MGIEADPYQKICRNSACKKNYKAKRLNQEYCCPDCKKKCCNKKAADERNLMKAIDSALKINRRILEWYYYSQKNKVDIRELTGSGFNLNYHTSRSLDGENKYSILDIYNYSLEKLNDTEFQIKKRW